MKTDPTPPRPNLFYLLISALSIIISAIILAKAAHAETRIASWNIKRMTAENKDFDSLVTIAAYFDLIAVQEVMEEAAIVRLVNDLQNKTGVEWGVMNSHAIGRGSYKEHYSFVWRKSHVEFVDSALVYLDHRDVFAREPLSARFRTKDGETFIAANIHVLYGDDKEDRVPEIEALAEYWQWLGETFPEEQFFLMGDFNMTPDDIAFSALRNHAVPLIQQGATTLSTNNGQFANLYDNIWVPKNMRAEVSAGILDFPKALEITHKTARDQISDHAPVYMIIDGLDETSGHYVPANAVEVVHPIHGNKNSGIYHMPDCPNYADLTRSSNLIKFETEVQAQKAGFRIAGNC